jgi:hypothetical protein
MVLGALYSFDGIGSLRWALSKSILFMLIAAHQANQTASDTQSQSSQSEA